MKLYENNIYIGHHFESAPEAWKNFALEMKETIGPTAFNNIGGAELGKLYTENLAKYHCIMYPDQGNNYILEFDSVKHKNMFLLKYG